MPKVPIDAWHCNVCGNNWLGRTKEKPLRCSKCKSPYWDREKTKK